jgi:hypothetical protein
MTRVRSIAAIWLIVVAGILGPSIVGARVFLGTDLLERFAPWASVPPDDVVIANPLVGDTVDSLAPSRALFQDRLLDGNVAPKVNGYDLGGTALATTPNYGFYSPLNLPYWVFPSWFAPVIAKILELIAATGFMFLFLRRLELSRSSALVAGLVYAFSGFQVVWTNWPQAHIGALIPGVFWGVEYAIQKRAFRSVIPLALVTAVMWLEGFPAVTAFALLFAGVYALVRVWSSSGWSARAKGLGLSLAGVLGGVALAAFQLVPFAFLLGGLDTTSRIQEPNWYLARRTLATLGVPNAFGSPVDLYYGPADYLIYGPVNYVEIQVFIGIAALGLIALAAVYGSRIVRRSTFWYLWLAAGFAVALMYFASPLLNAFHALPLLGTNHVGRLRSVLLFLLAALAGIGFEAVVRRLPASATNRDRIGVIAALGVELVVIAWALQRAGEMAAAANLEDYFDRQVAIAAVIAVVVLALIAVIHLNKGRLAQVAFALIPVVIAVEIVMFALPYWPQVPRDQYYPVTDTHRYLEANLGGERIAPGDTTLYPSTTTFYKIRSVTAHAFTSEEWGEALVAVDPDAFRFSATFTTLRSTPEIAMSSMLDRMSAAFFAAPPEVELFGVRETSTVVAPSTLGPGESFDVSLEGRTVAGVEIVLPAGHDPGPGPETIATEVLAGNGAVITNGFRRITRFVGAGPFQVAVPSAPDGQTLRIRNGGDTPIVLSPEPVVLVTATEALPVAFAGGAVLYRRETALPRIRWAPAALVIPDPEDRVAALSHGIPPDTVILSDPTDAATGGGATIDVVEDGAADRIEVRVSADGPGFLVVADSMQSAWVATLDGETVEILAADHVGVAVPVPAGTHVVVFDADPAGWDLGLWISFLTAVAVIAILVVHRMRSSRTDVDVEEEPEPST